MKSGGGKSLSRRSVLKGAGAAVAVPFLGAMSPASARSRNLEGRVALVTGSGRNLGRAAVLELARRGADVVVNTRSNRDEAEAVAREARAMGVRALALTADVGSEEQVDRMVREALGALGRIDILINNAGFRAFRPITQMSTQDWRDAMAVNADGPFFCTRAVVPSMIANRWGRIITVSGLNSLHGMTNWVHTCASKYGALGMTRALAVELAPHNILVNNVAPGAFDTSEESPAPGSPAPPGIPVGRRGLPQELANVYAFLASEEASFITGQTIHVNGGELRV